MRCGQTGREQGERLLEIVETRASDPHEPGSQVATLVPLPGSVLGAATIVAAQGALGASGSVLAVFATHATRVELRCEVRRRGD